MKLTLNKHQLNKLDKLKLQKVINALKSGKYEKHKKYLISTIIHNKACCLGVCAIEVDHSPLSKLTTRNPEYRTSPFAFRLGLLKLKQLNTKKPINKIGLAALNDGFEFIYKNKPIEIELTHPEIAELLEGKTMDYSSRLFHY